MYDVAIVGAGPAGIFTALEIVKLRPEWKVVLIEKGQRIEKRKCPIREGSPKCVNCKRCGLLCGWGGAGAFSDGKLTLTPDVGGHLVDYMSRENAKELIKYALKANNEELEDGDITMLYDSIINTRNNEEKNGAKISEYYQYKGLETNLKETIIGNKSIYQFRIGRIKE